MKECKSEYCTECMQQHSEQNYSRHYLMNPEPSKKRCDFCYEKHDRPIDKQIRASVAESDANKSEHETATGEVSALRQIEIRREQMELEKEFEL